MPPEIINHAHLDSQNNISESPRSFTLFTFFIFANLIGEKKKGVLEEVTFAFSSGGEDEPILMGLKVMWISEKKLLDSQEKQV